MLLRIYCSFRINLQWLTCDACNHKNELTSVFSLLCHYCFTTCKLCNELFSKCICEILTQRRSDSYYLIYIVNGCLFNMSIKRLTLELLRRRLSQICHRAVNVTPMQQKPLTVIWNIYYQKKCKMPLELLKRQLYCCAMQRELWQNVAFRVS